MQKDNYHGDLLNSLDHVVVIVMQHNLCMFFQVPFSFCKIATPAAVVVVSPFVLWLGIYLDEVGLWIKPFGCRSTMFFLFFWGLQPWEEKMKSAQKQGTLVQLSNLDPAYTSKQVEVMSILCKERCLLL